MLEFGSGACCVAVICDKIAGVIYTKREKPRYRHRNTCIALFSLCASGSLLTCVSLFSLCASGPVLPLPCDAVGY